ncbi:MAG: hypothetical protein K9J17_17595 [Flavobacteriales bacterium]|nr:hypothetical protein [Flavobacteriales bacterium]
MKQLTFILPFLLFVSCSSDTVDMTVFEQSFATKYEAEKVSVTYNHETTETDGRTTEDRTFMLCEIVNSISFNSSFENQLELYDKAKKLADELAENATPNSDFDYSEIQVNVIRKKGIWIVRNEKMKTFNFNAQ